MVPNLHWQLSTHQQTSPASPRSKLWHILNNLQNGLWWPVNPGGIVTMNLWREMPWKFVGSSQSWAFEHVLVNCDYGSEESSVSAVSFEVAGQQFLRFDMIFNLLPLERLQLFVYGWSSFQEASVRSNIFVSLHTTGVRCSVKVSTITKQWALH